MFIDVKDGIKKVKDGSIVFKTFGVLAIILLIPFLLCSGVAKIIFGVLFAIVVLFILATLFMCFIRSMDLLRIFVLFFVLFNVVCQFTGLHNYTTGQAV